MSKQDSRNQEQLRRELQLEVQATVLIPQSGERWKKTPEEREALKKAKSENKASKSL